MSTTHADAPAPRSVSGSRATRHALRTEQAQVARWRRLLRARLDLEIAGFAPPEPLGVASGDELPASRVDLPSTVELTTAVRVVTPLDPIELMTRLRDLDRRLAAYAKDVAESLEECTHDVVRELAAGAGAAVDAIGRPATAEAPGAGVAR